MSLGWKIFKYSRTIRDYKDLRSICNTDLSRYNQTLYIGETADKLRIYSNRNKQIEAYVLLERVEIRLAVWDEYTSQVAILESVRVDEVQLKEETADQVLRAVKGEDDFEVVFYKKEYKKDFIKEVEKRRLYLSVINELNRSRKRSFGVPPELEEVVEFLRKFKDLIRKPLN